MIGTGKTLALLTSTLSWQQKRRTQNLQPILSSPGENDPHVDVGLTNSSSINSPHPAKSVAGELTEPPSEKQTVYFCSRTHSQLQQVLSR